MNIFEKTDHRPWELPAVPFVMWQQWHELLFAHWALPPDLLRPIIPSDLKVDTFDGSAWLGVVPFRMSGVRGRMLPNVRGTSAFPELNVRTYVVIDDKPGVFFFSLDAGNPLAVWAARQFFYLPYFNADMSCQLGADGMVKYRSHRTHRNAPPAVLEASYRPIGEIYHSQDGSLEHWLTSRYCLYTTNRRGEVLRGDIHHLPWDLQAAEGEFHMNTMASSHGIALPDVPPLLHYVHWIEVAIYPLRKVK